MKVAAIAGFSGAGKTTLIVELIRRFVAQGKRVGAIKHTHHALNEEHRGDTARFLEAGAEPVILAGAGEAVIFHRDGTARARYGSAHELLACFDSGVVPDVVLIEGFKDSDAWPLVTIDVHGRPTVEDVMTGLDVMWRSK
ncbi:MAG: molybdopterin-guanine dinucleotide biosynthesis adapter protein [Acidobacteriota bacterium]|jgi:molybdopterin-guanine dinucleotide biosynthesis protein B|nr:molybdopterin-guanine dinucleotide biosynthesis adapter protein [Acidobacteriota bacterium]